MTPVEPGDTEGGAVIAFTYFNKHKADAGAFSTDLCGSDGKDCFRKASIQIHRCSSVCNKILNLGFGKRHEN